MSTHVASSDTSPPISITSEHSDADEDEHGSGDTDDDQEAVGSDVQNSQRVELGTLDGIAIVAGIQLGSGIFTSPAAVYNGAGSPVGAIGLWIAGGLIAWTGAKSIAELGIRVPSNGGLMDYLALCWGWRIACTTSWLWILLITPCSSAILCLVASTHFLPLMPAAVAESVWGGRVIALITIAAATICNWNGVRQSQLTSRFFIVVKLLGLTLVIVTGFGLALLGPDDNTHMPEADRGHTIDFSELGHGLFEALWAYSGWESLGFVAAEVQNPTRQVPRILDSSMTLVAAVFLLVNVGYFLSLPEDRIAHSRTLAAELGTRAFGQAGALLFSALVCVTCVGVVNNKVFAASRLISWASASGYIPSFLGTAHSGSSTAGRGNVFAIDGNQKAMLLNAGLTLIYINIDSLRSLIALESIVEYLTLITLMTGLLHLRLTERARGYSPVAESQYQTSLFNPAFFCVACFLGLGLMLIENIWTFAAVITFSMCGMLGMYLKERSLGKIPNESPR